MAARDDEFVAWIGERLADLAALDFGEFERVSGELLEEAERVRAARVKLFHDSD